MSEETADPNAGGRPGDEPLEIEIKFAVARPDVVRALIDDPDPARLAGFVAGGEVHVEVMTDRYLDTMVGGGALFLAGMRARLRVSEAGVVLAVKRRGVVSEVGVTTRVEVQGPASAVMDPTTWPPSDARALLLATVGGARLVEIAALRQVRHTRSLRRGDALVEVSLDEMAALADDRPVAHRVELEAELKGGPATALDALAEALAELEGIGPPVGSKLEFALAAARSGASA